MALAAAIAEANREKAVTLPALGAERTSSSKPEKRLGDLVHSESMPRMLGEVRGGDTDEVGWLSGAARPGEVFLPRNRRVTANLASRAAKILTFETLRPFFSNRF